jgi:REP element-mobilizing transposase RayT
VAKRRKQPMQLSLAARGQRGGYRARAGRKRKPEHKRTSVAHRRRPELPSKTPVHVALRLVEGLPSLRQHKAVRYVRRCLQLAHKERFRVVHFSVQSNHVHLLIEAEDSRALSRGMQGLKIRLAKRLNALFGRRGTLFTERYHARPITSPRQARHTIGYVLGNARKHAAERGRALGRNWVDPFSSAPTFDGWACATVTSDGATEPGITAEPEFWLLRTAWRRYGPLDPNAVPGPGG